MRLAVLHQAITDDNAPDERDVLDQLQAVGRALAALGHSWTPFACTLDLSALADRLQQDRPDLVFNLVESLAGTGRLIHLVPALLDALAVPYTGAGMLAVLATSHKVLAKARLAAAGLPTPAWIGPVPPDLPASAVRPADPKGRWLIKSLWEHASVGLDEGALITGEDGDAAAAALTERAQQTGTAWFAEEYIEGREFNLALLGTPDGPRLLKPAEITFDGFPPEALKIVGYRAKWDPESYEYRHTPRRFDFPAADAPLLDRLEDLARRCWKLFGLKGYARVDFRVDAAGAPWILEVNTNPCLSPDAGFAAALEATGIGFDEAVARILKDARPRSAAQPPPAPQPVAARVPPQEIAWRFEVGPDDPGRIRRLVAATGFFNAAEIEVAEELVRERLAKGASSGYEFVLAEAQGELIGYACFGSVPMTSASFDLYWIAVAPAVRRRGFGRLLLAEAERLVRRAGGARLYAETSGRAQYAETRAFYHRTGFTAEAVLKDFYAPGDDRITYSKQL